MQLYLPVLCSLKQTKPNILKPTKHNKTNVGVYLLRKNDFIFHKNIFYIFSFCPVCLDDCGHCAANKQNVVCILRFRARCVSAGHWWRGPAALCGAGVKIFVVCTRRTMMCQHHWWPLTHADTYTQYTQPQKFWAFSIFLLMASGWLGCWLFPPLLSYFAPCPRQQQLRWRAQLRHSKQCIKINTEFVGALAWWCTLRY